MSSTNRSEARKEHKADYYVTPIKDIELFLKSFDGVEPGVLDGKLILDPCAGGDAKYPMSYPEALGNYPLKELKTVDIREDSRAETIADYLKLKLGEAPDVIITNPPFNIALDVIKKSIEDVKDDGYVVMLLRLNFLGSQSRKPFFEGNMPKYIFVHHERMSFYPDGLIDPKTGRKKKGTDSIEYCHMVWQKGFKTDNSELYVI